MSIFSARSSSWLAAAALLAFAACSSPDDDASAGEPGTPAEDDAGASSECERGFVLQDGACVPRRPAGDAGSDDADDDDADPVETPDAADAAVDADEPDAALPPDPTFAELFPIDEQMVARCEDGVSTTTVTGIVHIPAGTLPLPGVTVYVPRDLPGRVRNGASCEACDDALSGVPMVYTDTAVDGTFSLRGVPHDRPFPLVIEVGKWRRMITVPAVEACQETALDPELTRLPRSRAEGHLPQFAVTTGEYDSIECLLRKIGIDESEFSTNDVDGRVHLFAGRGGTPRFAPSLHGGAEFTRADAWWDDVLNLLAYDAVLHSCTGNEQTLPPRSEASVTALRNYANAGGRVFLSHYHYDWLSQGPPDFQSVAQWGLQFVFTNDVETGYIDTSFRKGEELAEWMEHVGAAVDASFPINEVRTSMRSLDERIATPWVSIRPGGAEAEEYTQYFSFNTPIGTPPEDQCGRVVFSDIHIASGDTSSVSTSFPNGCTTTAFSPQEKAIVFLLFDLSRCIVPDKI